MLGLGAAFDEIWLRDGARYPGHLALLDLHDCDREVAILRTCARSEDVEPTIRAMLAQANWRPHLVAGTAIAFLERDGRYRDALWFAVDAGSWVSPQLAVILSMHDPAFVASAVERARACCPMTGAFWGERTVGEPNVKTLSALIALLEELAPTEAQSIRVSEPVRALLEAPRDHGDRIALRWRDALLARIA